MSDKVEQHPNIFEYATKELSQDAVICWLLAWAQPSMKCLDEGMHEAGQIFLRSLLKLFEKDEDEEEKEKEEVKEKDIPTLASLESIDIKTQDKRADVTAILKCKPEEKYCLLIEDKTRTYENRDAMKKYINAIAKKYNLADNRILPIYFKTHPQSDLTKVREIGYKPYGLKDLLCALYKGKDKIGNRNLIYSQCLEYFQALNEIYKRDPKSNPYCWWNEWIGLFDEIQKPLQKESEKKSEKESEITNEPSWQWSIVPSPSGSYPILWQNVRNDTSDKPVLYVQLDGGEGTVRMSPGNTTEAHEKREKIWDRLYEKLNEEDKRIPVTREEGKKEKDFQFKSGKTCKVFEFRYLMREENEKFYVIKHKGTTKDMIDGPFTIDISKTVERILAVSKVLPEVKDEVFNSDTN